MSKNQSESSDNEFFYILYLTPFINTHNNGRLQWHVALNVDQTIVIKMHLQLFLKQVNFINKKNEKREA